MRNQRSFSLEFKRQVVGELLSRQSRPAQLCRRYNISSSLLYHWKRRCSRGKFNNEPTEEAALRDRMESFFKTLKHEELYLSEHETLGDVTTRLPYSIEEVCNQKRLHSALDYQSPNDFEELLMTRQNKDVPRQTLLTFSVQS